MQAERALLLSVHLLNAVYVLVTLIHPPHLVVNWTGRLRVHDVARRLVPDPETRRVLLQGARQVVEGRPAAHLLQFVLDVHHHTLRTAVLRSQRGFSRLRARCSCSSLK